MTARYRARTETRQPESENYLASVSDLMAGLIFVFILTLLVFALYYQEATGDLTDSLVIRQEILLETQRALRERGIAVEIDAEQGVLRFPEGILFPLGSAELQPEGERALRILAGVFGQVLPCYAGRLGDLSVPGCPGGDRRGKLDAVFIEGHTDDLPIRTPAFPDNWTLSAARAIRTYEMLVSVIPELDQLRNYSGQPLLSVSGYADRRPIVANVDKESRQQNRRIDFRFIMATPQPPEVVAELEQRLGLR